MFKIKKEPSSRELLMEELRQAMREEVNYIRSDDPDVDKAAATLRLTRLMEQYEALESNDLEKYKTKSEARSNMAVPVITGGLGLVATGAWIMFEKTEIITGQSGKEIVRQVIGTLFRKK